MSSNPPNEGANEVVVVLDELSGPPTPGKAKTIGTDAHSLLERFLDAARVNAGRPIRHAPTHRIRFWGRRDPQGNVREVMPGMAGVDEFELHESGEWLITTDAETGQEAYVRISNLVATITADVEEPFLGHRVDRAWTDENAAEAGA